MYGTPAMFIDMLNHPDFHNYDFSSLRTGMLIMWNISPLLTAKICSRKAFLNRLKFTVLTLLVWCLLLVGNNTS